MTKDKSKPQWFKMQYLCSLVKETAIPLGKINH